ncbi:MAG: cyclic nucleotide-binding domain-containing protein [Geodermatophilaceae bacterium]|nr:cyclic nucleotide-binding domain-containing protein [Geodermatophilaceae bacterium]
MATAGRSVEEQLAAADPFSRVGKRALRALASAAKSVEHAEGHRVIEEGGTPLGFHLITEGEAIVEIGGTERRRLKPGDSFGLVSLIDGKPRSATIRAATPMRTLFISPWVFGPVLEAEPTIARDLLPMLCTLLRDAEAQRS